MAIEHCQQIFDEFPKRFNPDAAGDWTTKIQFKISGSKGGNWVLTVADGKCTVEKGTTDDAKTVIQTDDETWIGLVTGSVNAMSAFMGGKIKVDGDLGDAMKLSNQAVFPVG